MSRPWFFLVFAMLVVQVYVLVGIREHARTLAARPAPEAPAPGPCPGPRVQNAI